VSDTDARRLAPVAPHQPRPARDAAHALERGGVVGKKVDKAVNELKSSRQSLSAARAPDIAREQASEDGGADATDRRR
jgi:hypothetical protein